MSSIYKRFAYALWKGIGKAVSERKYEISFVLSAVGLYIAQLWAKHQLSMDGLRKSGGAAINSAVFAVCFFFLLILIEALIELLKEIAGERKILGTPHNLGIVTVRGEPYQSVTIANPYPHYKIKLLTVAAILIGLTGLSSYLTWDKTNSWDKENEARARTRMKQEAGNKITISVYPPPGRASILASLFSVTNDSDNDISVYRLWCSVNKLQFANKTALMAHSIRDRSWSYKAIDSSVPLLRGHHSDSNSCLEHIMLTPADVVCADVIITFQYVLDIDGDSKVYTGKEARFVTENNNGTFTWMDKNVNDPHFYCMELKPPDDWRTDLLVKAMTIANDFIKTKDTKVLSARYQEWATDAESFLSNIYGQQAVSEFRQVKVTRPAKFSADYSRKGMKIYDLLGAQVQFISGYKR
jgi:hypothetical protein